MRGIFVHKHWYFNFRLEMVVFASFSTLGVNLTEFYLDFARFVYRENWLVFCKHFGILTENGGSARFPTFLAKNCRSTRFHFLWKTSVPRDFQFMRKMFILARFSAFPVENIVSARFPVIDVGNEFCSARFAISA